MTSASFNAPFVLYGGDYNPEQWPRETWDEDTRLMRLAHINIATLPVFGWANLETSEGIFDFDWLDDVVSRLTENDVNLCFATATASVPAWVTQNYSDVLVTDENGVKRKHGGRHSFCPNSPNFRRLSTALVRKLAERYGNHPGLLLWHIGNEYGTLCWCDLCAEAFRVWLKEKYGSLFKLNECWYTMFWGHTFSDWAQIEPPYTNGERNIQAQRIDYYRFQTQSLLNCFRAEAQILREITPNVPITTNLMGAFFPLNYQKWAKEMDIVSWDNYPAPDAPPADVAFSHALMRGLKEGQSFLLMEQSPSQQNWQPYNWLKTPGLLRSQSFQAVANGADAVMYFQWRRGRGGIEKLHGAVVEHGGDETNRVFKEVAALGAELKRLGDKTVGARTDARVALLWDWENWWALRFGSGPSRDLDYQKECRAVWAALFSLGIPAEILAPDADLTGYDVIIAPVLAMLRQDAADRITQCVENGAAFLTTFFSGMNDENDQVYLSGSPGPLAKVLGLRVEETDALPSSKTNGLRFDAPWNEINAGQKFEATLLCDRIRLAGAAPLAVYDTDFYAGEPAFTVNDYGKGKAYYLATRPDAGGLQAIIGAVCREKGVVSPLADGAAPPSGVEVAVRVSSSGNALIYLLNHNKTEPATVSLPFGNYEDLLTGETLNGATVELPGLGVRILAKR